LKTKKQRRLANRVEKGLQFFSGRGQEEGPRNTLSVLTGKQKGGVLNNRRKEKSSMIKDTGRSEGEG